jgi:tripartite-type tricarboxylate transporter receptor subunit TctC
MMSKASGALLLLLIANLADGSHAAAELLSARPITIIIPYTPGASAYTLQRVVGREVTQDTGQVLVVESRPGGGGAVASAVVKQALPDGHTLLQANSGTHATNVALYSTLPYDPIKDFTPITLMWSFPQLLAVPLDSPAQSVSDLVALAKATPGGLSFASQGSGSGGHLLGEMLKARSGAGMVHIPYRGAGPALTDAISGHIPMITPNVTGQVIELNKTGKLRILAVTTATRVAAAPDIPTAIEAGLPNMISQNFVALFATAGMPKPIIEQIAQATRAALADSELQQMFHAAAFEPRPDSGPEHLRRFLDDEIARWSPIIKSINLKLD